MKLIKFPTIWSSNQELEDMGIDSGEKKGWIYINPAQIQGVNESTNENECTIRMNGDAWRIKLPLEDVLKTLSES